MASSVRDSVGGRHTTSAPPARSNPQRISCWLCAAAKSGACRNPSSRHAAAFPEIFHPALPGGHTITRNSSPVMECPLKFSEGIEEGTKDFLMRQQSLQEVSRSKNLKKRSRKRNAQTKPTTKTVSACSPH